jgi:hypothetical protein
MDAFGTVIPIPTVGYPAFPSLDWDFGFPNAHPPFGVEVEAGAFESQLMIGHDKALH